jgi:hypothetical protein
MDIQTNDISLDIIKESVMVFEEAPHSDTILNNINPIELNNNNPVELNNNNPIELNNSNIVKLNNSNIVESNNIESDITYDYKDAKC